MDSKKCFNMNCTETTNSQDFHKCLNRECGKFVGIESVSIHIVLQMAQESLDPGGYESFVKIYNQLIDTRQDLNNEKVGLG